MAARTAPKSVSIEVVEVSEEEEEEEEEEEQEQEVSKKGGRGAKGGAKFKPGDRVLAKFLDGGWYGALITGTKGDNFVIQWDDSDSRDRSCLRP
eukprot:740274-Rhodomonas_salina.1